MKVNTSKLEYILMFHLMMVGLLICTTTILVEMISLNNSEIVAEGNRLEGTECCKY